MPGPVEDRLCQPVPATQFLTSPNSSDVVKCCRRTADAYTSEDEHRSAVSQTQVPPGLSQRAVTLHA
jgi:hypothetical protein